jgi:hypothetical protein
MTAMACWPVTDAEGSRWYFPNCFAVSPPVLDKRRRTGYRFSIEHVRDTAHSKVQFVRQETPQQLQSGPSPYV